jgi:protein-arginine kinase activator protein McsA
MINIMIQNGLVDVMQKRLDWCVQTERYEMAARIRDLIIYNTTDDEEYKHNYYLELLKRYSS